MKPQNHHLSLLSLILISFSLPITSSSLQSPTNKTKHSTRRVLHEPLFPVTSSPPPPPPPPATSAYPNPEQPFFPETPTSPPTNPDQNQPPPPPPANGTIPIPAATQHPKPGKKVAIAIAAGIVTLGMLSAFAFFLYRHRVKQPRERDKLFAEGGNSGRIPDESGVPPSSFLYIGTVEPSTTSVAEANETNTINGSPYHKLSTIKRFDRYRPSPDLQPLPPLPKPTVHLENDHNSPPAGSSSSDEESRETAFYTPQASSASNDDGYYTPISVAPNYSSKGSNLVRSASGKKTSLPHSKRTSPRSRLSSVYSPEMKPPLPLPPPPNRVQESPGEDIEPTSSYITKRPKFSSPPPPPDIVLLRSISAQGSSKAPAPPPPPPPPPPPLPPMMAMAKAGKVESSKPSKASGTLMSPTILKDHNSWTPTPKTSSDIKTKVSVEQVHGGNDAGEYDGGKPKLKPLHWDKVRATSDRATVWDRIKSSSFQLNEDMMESLFVCNPGSSAPKEPTRKSGLPPVDNENRVLDPKKSQNIAILLRALNVTRDEVSEALLDGNPESLGAELLETLVKMAPTKEEEIKLRDYRGDISKLGSAERFLKTVLDVPFAFKRVEAMLYRANFNTEVRYLRRSFQTLEEASEELKNSRLFLKLLEAVLRTGNRMNVGTNRGGAKAFKLDTLLKLVDIKGTDGKTTLLHFVVQEIIRSEGLNGDPTNENLEGSSHTMMGEEDFRKQGLQVVSGLSRDLSNVKKAAGMDSDVLSSYVSKLETGLEKVRSVLQYEQPDMQGKFFQSMKLFLRDADEEITGIKADERKALALVKEVTEYFHGDAAKEEAHPLRIFMIVRDFLSILDNVCKEVGNMQDRTVVGSSRSFRISATASLPVLNRYNVTQDSSSDEGSSSP